jgi:hypothetical protein
MSTSLKHYLTTIENALKAGNATEHTHRPALKALLESLDLRITATNEPKRIACGAPDYIITRDDLPWATSRSKTWANRWLKRSAPTSLNATAAP